MGAKASFSTDTPGHDNSFPDEPQCARSRLKWGFKENVLCAEPTGLGADEFDQRVTAPRNELLAKERDCKRSVEVMPKTSHEAAVLGVKAMNVPSERLHLLSLDVLVKAPQVYHSISGVSLNACLAQPGKNPKEQ